MYEVRVETEVIHRIRRIITRWKYFVRLIIIGADPIGSANLRPGSMAARLLGSWFRISAGAWKSVSRDCCVLSGRNLCVVMVTLPEES